MEPVFIAGINRSGTHLLFSLLSGHSRLFVTGLEDDMVTALAEHGDEFERAFAAASIGKLYRALLAHTVLPNLRLMATRGGRRYSRSLDGHQTMAGFALDYGRFERDLLDRLSGPNLVGLAVDRPADAVMAFYESLCRAFAEDGKPLVVAKPGKGAQGFVAARRFLLSLRPRILYMLRDPRAIACSNTRGRGLVTPFVEEWRTDLDALDALDADFPVHRVRYEELCRDPEPTMRRVAEFIDVAFEDVLLRPTLQGETFAGNSSFEGFDGAISEASVERWTSVLTTTDMRAAERAAGDRLASAGYQALGGGARRRRVLGVLVDPLRRRVGGLRRGLVRGKAPVALAAFVAGALVSAGLLLALLWSGG